MSPLCFPKVVRRGIIQAQKSRTQNEEKIVKRNSQASVFSPVESPGSGLPQTRDRRESDYFIAPTAPKVPNGNRPNHHKHPTTSLRLLRRRFRREIAARS